MCVSLSLYKYAWIGMHTYMLLCIGEYGYVCAHVFLSTYTYMDKVCAHECMQVHACM